MKRYSNIVNNQKWKSNHKEISPTLSSKRLQIINIGEDVESKLLPCSGNGNSAATIENSIEFPQKAKIQNLIQPYLSPGYFQMKKMKTQIENITHTQCS